VSSRRIFISKASISFGFSRVISIYFYVPGPLIFVTTFLLDPSNLFFKKKIAASIAESSDAKITRR
jgi:hypothetical protein